MSERRPNRTSCEKCNSKASSWETCGPGSLALGCIIYNYVNKWEDNFYIHKDCFPISSFSRYWDLFDISCPAPLSVQNTIDQITFELLGNLEYHWGYNTYIIYIYICICVCGCQDMYLMTLNPRVNQHMQLVIFVLIDTIRIPIKLEYQKC